MKERIKQGKNKSLNNNNNKKGQNQSHKFPFTSKNGLQLYEGVFWHNVLLSSIQKKEFFYFFFVVVCGI
jgi:hypothetical protein